VGEEGGEEADGYRGTGGRVACAQSKARRRKPARGLRPYVRRMPKWR